MECLKGVTHRAKINGNTEVYGTEMNPEKNAEGGWHGAKWQTIVFQKQTRVGTREFHSRYLHPYVASLSFLWSLCSSDLTSTPTREDPSQHSQNSRVKFHQAHNFLLPQAAASASGRIYIHARCRSANTRCNLSRGSPCGV